MTCDFKTNGKTAADLKIKTREQQLCR